MKTYRQQIESILSTDTTEKHIPLLMQLLDQHKRDVLQGVVDKYSECLPEQIIDGVKQDIELVGLPI